MPTPAAPPSRAPTDAELDALTDRASALARDVAATTERERALPQALVDELCATGLMRAGAPVALGALEASPATTLGGAERIARGDASAGWCVSIAATSSLLAAYLPDAGRLGDLRRSIHGGRWRVGATRQGRRRRRWSAGLGPLVVLQRDLPFRVAVRGMRAR